MKNLILFIYLFASQFVKAQTKQNINPTANIRLSFLIFPFTPLFSAEIKTMGNLTIQYESNFKNTHGANIKYYTNQRMEGQFLFLGIAFLENKLLRIDEKITILPYAGYGYAYKFGNRKNWTFDNRVGIGSTTNADKNSIYPVIKTGLGYIL